MFRPKICAPGPNRRIITIERLFSTGYNSDKAFLNGRLDVIQVRSAALKEAGG